MSAFPSCCFERQFIGSHCVAFFSVAMMKAKYPTKRYMYWDPASNILSTDEWQRLCRERLQKLWILERDRVRSRCFEKASFEEKLLYILEDLIHEKRSNEEIVIWFKVIPQQYWNFTEETPLHLASCTKNADLIRHLLHIGYNEVNKMIYGNTNELQTALDRAIFAGNPEVVKVLIDAGASFERSSNAPFLTNSLFLATFMAQLDIVKILIEAGADVNITSSSYSPLHLAVTEYHNGVHKHPYELHGDKVSEVVEFLIKKGAEVNYAAENNLTALHLAIGFEHFESVAVLLESDANILMGSEILMTPLHISASNGHFGLVKYFIERRGVDVNITVADNSWTPLCCAIEAGNYEMTKMLIKYGSSIKFAHISNFGPLHYAILTNNRKLFELVLCLGTDVDVLNIRVDHEDKPDRWSPNKFNRYTGVACLHVAALYMRENMFTRLLELDSDINVKSQENFSVLYYAIINDFKDCYKNEIRLKWLRNVLSKGAGKSFDFVADFKAFAHFCQYTDEETMRFFLGECGIDLKAHPEKFNIIFESFTRNPKHGFKLIKFLVDIFRTHKNGTDIMGKILCFVIKRCGIPCLKYLLKAKANVNVICPGPNNSTITPLGLAISRNDPVRVRLLLIYNADTSFGDDSFISQSVQTFRNRLTSETKDFLTLLIIRHIAIKDQLGKPLRPGDFEIIKSDLRFEQFYEKFKIELTEMQQYRICGKMTMFDVLVDPNRYLNNRYIVELSMSEHILQEFSAYCDIWTEYFEKAQDRYRLMKKAECGLTRILRCDSAAFYSVFQKIFVYLDNESLNNLTMIN